MCKNAVTFECFSTASFLFGFRVGPARDPVADVQQFVSEFETDYGTHHPRFLTCGYDEVCTLP